MTIKQLRQQGYKVRVIHTRNYNLVIKFNSVCSELVCSELSARGGKTEIEITTPDRKYDVFGVSYCSERDNFNHKIGNEIAVKRALEVLNELISNEKN